MVQEVQTKNVTQVKFYFSFTPDVLADVFSLPDGRRLIKLHSYRGVIDPDAWEIIDYDDDHISNAVKIDTVETVEVGEFCYQGETTIKVLTVMVDDLVVGVMNDRVIALGRSVEDVVKSIAKALDRSVIDAFVEALEEMKKNVTKR